MATLPLPPRTVRGGGYYSLSTVLWHCWCVPLILPFPLHCPAEQNQLECHSPVLLQEFICAEQLLELARLAFGQTDERGVAQGVLGIYLCTTQEQPVSYLLQSQLGRKLP